MDIKLSDNNTLFISTNDISTFTMKHDVYYCEIHGDIWQGNIASQHYPFWPLCPECAKDKLKELGVQELKIRQEKI